MTFATFIQSNIWWIIGFIMFIWCIFRAFKWLLKDENRKFVIDTIKSYKSRHKSNEEEI